MKDFTGVLKKALLFGVLAAVILGGIFVWLASK